jgi:hypothetical protein
VRIRKKSQYVCASRQVGNILRYIMCRRRVSLLVPKPHGSLQEQGSSILFALEHKHSHRVLPLPSAAKARHTTCLALMGMPSLPSSSLSSFSDFVVGSLWAVGPAASTEYPPATRWTTFTKGRLRCSGHGQCPRHTSDLASPAPGQQFRDDSDSSK